jgi:hypothetical protein
MYFKLNNYSGLLQNKCKMKLLLLAVYIVVIVPGNRNIQYTRVRMYTVVSSYLCLYHAYM